MVSSTSRVGSGQPAGVPLAVLSCLAIAITYVGLLYIWRGNLPRNHPTTVKRRLFSISLACSVLWLPAFFWATRVHHAHAPVHKLLGLRLEGLPRAVGDSLLLVATLFAGPLVYFLYCMEVPWARAPPRPLPRPSRALGAATVTGGASGGPDCGDVGAATVAGAGRNGSGPPASEEASLCLLRRRLVGGQEAAASCDLGLGGGCCGGDTDGSADAAAASCVPAAAGWRQWIREAASDVVRWRDLVFAPLSEEFAFRACMVPLLVLEGVSSRAVVFLTPLFFGAAHVHHMLDLVRHQGVSVRGAALMVGFQMLYTTVFGWLATYLFLRTGHLAAPVAVHMFCNWAGFPPFADMAAHPRGGLLLLTTAAGVAAFFAMLPRMTAPSRFGQDFYAS